jgi:outer membrane protein assembly factor BamA
VAFVGAKSLTEDELRTAIAAQIQEIAEGGVTAARADDTAYYLGAFYRKKGFASARVDYEIRGGTVVLKIEEGPRSLLRSVTFTGNRAIPDSTLWEYFLGATPERPARTGCADCIYLRVFWMPSSMPRRSSLAKTARARA